MTESDRETLARSRGANEESVWLPIAFAFTGFISGASSGGYIVSSKVQDIRMAFAIGGFVAGISLLVFGLFKLFSRLQMSRATDVDRDRHERLLGLREVEVVRFRADAAWRIPEDPCDDIDDQLNVVYRIGSDTFVMAPLYEYSLPGSGARVPSEAWVRRTPPPYLQPLTEFVPVGSGTLPLSEDLGDLESLSMEWANDSHETATAGGKLQLKDLPVSWRPIVSK